MALAKIGKSPDAQLTKSVEMHAHRDCFVVPLLLCDTHD